MNGVITAIIAVKTVILLLGGGITYIAFRAYRTTGESALRVLSVGFGIITVGAFVSGIVDQVFSTELEISILVNSIFVAIGLAIIMYSLYVQN